MAPPRAGRIGRAEFEALLERVRKTDFATLTVQAVVMVQGGDVEGTLGLIEKRRRKAAGLMVEKGVATALFSNGSLKLRGCLFSR